MLAHTTRACNSLRHLAPKSGRISAVRVMAFQGAPEQQQRIKVGQKIPLEQTVTVFKQGDDSPKPVKLGDIFGGKKGVLFGLPGAYTSVCSSKHVPEYKSKYAELQKAGVEVIACASVNDAFVMRHWAEDLGVDQNQILMLADGDAAMHKALGLTQSMPGMGERAYRYSMYVEDGEIKALNIEEPGGGSYKVSGPTHMLEVDLKALIKEGKTTYHTA